MVKSVLTYKHLKYLIKDESKASREYAGLAKRMRAKGYGYKNSANQLEKFARDEMRHHRTFVRWSKIRTKAERG